ncbi:MAG: carboxypeptidase-like regulatory domain-containing protein, partial [Bacteroidota bacterium]
MRRVYLLLLICLAVVTPLSAQVDGAERYDLPRRTLPLQKLLIKLNEAGAELSYRPDQIPSISLKSPGGSRTLENWLSFLLRDTELTFEDTGNGYIIFPDPFLFNRSFTISGTVTDQRSGERLIAAAIQDSLTNDGVLSNEYGFYTFTVTGGRRRLRFSYVGYASRTVDLVLKRDTVLNITMLPAGDLPEVIVTPTPLGVEETYLQETRSSIGPEETAQMG